MATKVYIMVGPPGSGKSTKTREILDTAFPEDSNDKYNYFTCSADEFFTDEETGIYTYEHDRIRDAHAYCLRKFIDRVKNYTVVIVDNCNVGKEAIAPYIAIASAYGCELHILKFPFTSAEELFKRNVHGVPLKSIQGMQRSMEYMFKTWPSYWPQPEEVK